MWLYCSGRTDELSGLLCGGQTASQRSAWICLDPESNLEILQRLFLTRHRRRRDGKILKQFSEQSAAISFDIVSPVDQVLHAHSGPVSDPVSVA